MESESESTSPEDGLLGRVTHRERLGRLEFTSRTPVESFSAARRFAGACDKPHPMLRWEAETCPSWRRQVGKEAPLWKVEGRRVEHGSRTVRGRRPGVRSTQADGKLDPWRETNVRRRLNMREAREPQGYQGATTRRAGRRPTHPRVEPFFSVPDAYLCRSPQQTTRRVCALAPT